MNKEVEKLQEKAREKFTDQYFIATRGRNDIRLREIDTLIEETYNQAIDDISSSGTAMKTRRKLDLKNYEQIST